MSEANSKRVLAGALALTALAALAGLAVLAVLGPDWGAYAPATCAATHCFCELPRAAALVVQPADSWSSYGFVLIGFVMILQAGSCAGVSALDPVAARTLGVTAIVVGLGSALFHATLTLWGQFLDVVGMYLIGSFFLVHALQRWRRLPERGATLLYLLLCGALIAVLVAMPEVRRWLFAVLLIVAIAVEAIWARPLRKQARFGLYLGGILATALAFVIWILDQTGAVCAPRSLVQGHALWHLLGALSLWLTYSFYRSERR